MIVLNLRLDGIYGFEDFKINFTYPKKVVNSIIDAEHLAGRERFRYKKAVVLMGANATGKTCLGKALHLILESLQEGFSSGLFSVITKEGATFSIDYVNDDNVLRRYESVIYSKPKRYTHHMYAAEIEKNDSYEMCVRKLKESNISMINDTKDPYSPPELNGSLKYRFSYPEIDRELLTEGIASSRLLKTLRAIIGTLDPTLTDVSASRDLKNTYIIRRDQQEIIIQEGKLLNREILSSGTEEGIDVAVFLASMMSGEPCFYYCDEHFSYIQSDIEKRIFGIMIDHIPANGQLIFTTHNTDMLDLNLPMHAYTFLRRNREGGAFRTSAISASELLKRNTDSLRRAVENDVFSTLPDDTLLDALEAGWYDE